MSHSSPPGAATSLTTAHCTKPEFQVEEECWGGGWREPWLWRMSKKLLGEQRHFQSRLPCTSFPGWNLWAYISSLITDEIYLHPTCSFSNWYCDTRSFVKRKGQLKVHLWCCLQTFKHCVTWEDQRKPDCHALQMDREKIRSKGHTESIYPLSRPKKKLHHSYYNPVLVNNIQVTHKITVSGYLKNRYHKIYIMIFFFLNEKKKKKPTNEVLLPRGSDEISAWHSFLPHWLRNAPGFASEYGQWLQQM